MCGRYSSKNREIRRLEAELELNAIRIVPRFNIAPTQFAPVVVMNDQAQPAVHEFRWGLVPAWSKTNKDAARLINARSETVATLPSFRSAFKSRRCLVIADGFYEWIQSKPKQPVRFVFRDPEMPMVMAGIWEMWCSANDAENQLKTFSILTTTPNEVAAKVHDRMPVILPPECWRKWIDPTAPLADVQAMLKPCEWTEMDSHWVTPAMSNARFEHASAVDPIAPNLPPEQLTMNSL